MRSGHAQGVINPTMRALTCCAINNCGVKRLLPYIQQEWSSIVPLRSATNTKLCCTIIHRRGQVKPSRQPLLIARVASKRNLVNDEDGFRLAAPPSSALSMSSWLSKSVQQSAASEREDGSIAFTHWNHSTCLQEQLLSGGDPPRRILHIIPSLAQTRSLSKLIAVLLFGRAGVPFCHTDKLQLRACSRGSIDMGNCGGGGGDIHSSLQAPCTTTCCAAYAPRPLPLPLLLQMSDWWWWRVAHLKSTTRDAQY